MPGRIIPPVVWMAVIYVLSDQPKLPYPEDLNGRLVSIAGHLTVYAVLAVLFWWALGISQLTASRRAIIAVGLATLYGFVDEWHQSFVPGRTPDGFDIVTDLVGATLAMLVVTWLERREMMSVGRRAWVTGESGRES